MARESGIDNNVQTDAEDQEAHAVVASLIVAQKFADGEVESLEMNMLKDSKDDELFKILDLDFRFPRKEKGRSYRASGLIFDKLVIDSLVLPRDPDQTIYMDW